MTKRNNNLTQTHQAVVVIKDKITHYRETGNDVKLRIYEAKLDDANKLIPRMEEEAKRQAKKMAELLAGMGKKKK